MARTLLLACALFVQVSTEQRLAVSPARSFLGPEPSAHSRKGDLTTKHTKSSALAVKDRTGEAKLPALQAFDVAKTVEASFTSATTCSWGAVYVLGALILGSLTPLIYHQGWVPYLTTIFYLSVLTLVKMYVKVALKGGFPFPYSLTSLHLLTTTIAAGCWDRPRLEEALKILPISLVMSVSLALNNTALVFGGVAFVSMIGCCTPACTCAVQVVSGRKQQTFQGLAVVAVVCLGGMMCVKGEKEFNLLAVFLAIGSAMGRSLKVVWQHDLLTVSLPPIRIAGWSSFWSLVVMLPLAAYYEGTQAITQYPSATAQGQLGVWMSTLTAVALNLVQCIGLKQLGPLMQNVVGNLQLIMVIVLASAWLGEAISVAQWIGVSMLVIGASLSKAQPATSEEPKGPEKTPDKKQVLKP